MRRPSSCAPMPVLLGCAALVCGAFTCPAQAGPFSQAIVVAADGTFLGTCSGTLGPLSVSNDFGSYGSSYAVHSMYNKYGDYGTTFGFFSPANPLGQPAYLFRGSTKLLDFLTAPGYHATPDTLAQMRSAGARRVTVSKGVTNAITPAQLKIACRAP